MRPETIEKYERVNSAREKGIPLEAALAAEKMGSATYYAVKAKRKTTRKYNKRGHIPQFIGLTPIPATRVAVVFCTPEQVKSVIEGAK